jgi:hypothetical protein
MSEIVAERTIPKRRAFLLALTGSAVGGAALSQNPASDDRAIKLPMKEGSFRFAILGDWGRGDRGQYETAAKFAEIQKQFPFDLVITTGDNIYGADGPADMKRKFEDPYKPLLAAGVKFQASLGNHDNPNQRFYKPFNMGGQRFYTFRPANTQNIRFFAIDSNYVDKEQTDWLEKELSSSTSDWKIPFFHHPLYSSGRTHGSALETRAVLEPLFVKHGVSAVFAGHDHFYERIKPQKGGIVHWVSGAGGSLRRGDIRVSEMTAKAFDTDYHFMIAEIVGDEMFFQAIARSGNTIDSGVVKRLGAAATVAAPLPAPSGTPQAGSSGVAPVPASPTPNPSPLTPAPVPAPTAR